MIGANKSTDNSIITQLQWVTGTIYLLLSESHHHLTPSNVTSKLTTLPCHNSHLVADRIYVLRSEKL